MTSAMIGVTENVGYTQAEAEAVARRENARGEWEAEVAFASGCGWYVVGKKMVEGTPFGTCWNRTTEAPPTPPADPAAEAGLRLALAEARALRASVIRALKAGTANREAFDRLVGGLVGLALPGHAEVLARYLRLRAANARRPFFHRRLAEVEVTGSTGTVLLRLEEAHRSTSQWANGRARQSSRSGHDFRVQVFRREGDDLRWVATGGAGTLEDARRAFREYSAQYARK